MLLEWGNKFYFLKNTFLRDLSFSSGKIFCKPTFVSLALSELCCLRCRQCDIWKNKPAKNKMTFSQRKEAILRIKKWLKYFKLNFAGGEPFLNKQTIPLVSFASSLGITTSINSNGYLIDGKMAKKIIESCLTHLNISLDSHQEKIHDRIRGVKGAYKRACDGIKLVKKFKNKKKNPLISITSIIMKDNLDDLVSLVYLVKKLDLGGILFQPLMSKYSFGSDPYNLFWYKNNPLWPNDYKKVNRTIDKLIFLKKSGLPIYNRFWELDNFKIYFKNPNSLDKMPCLVGLSNFAVDVKGNVRLCFNMKPVGNIKDQNPEVIWKGKVAHQRRIEIQNCRKSCRLLLCNRKFSLGQVFSEFFFRIWKKLEHRFFN